MLTQEQIAHFNEQGYLRIPQIFTPEEVEALRRELDQLGPNVELHHTTLHVKPPETGMPFPLHQDSPFYQHEGFSYVDALVHLDDTNDENGCLRFVPGSHKHGHLEHITQNCSPHLPTDQWRLENTVPCPAKA